MYKIHRRLLYTYINHELSRWHPADFSLYDMLETSEIGGLRYLLGKYGQTNCRIDAGAWGGGYGRTGSRRDVW